MKTLLRLTGKYFLLLLPLLLGMLGFLFVGDVPFLQALFNCVCMYCLNYQDAPANYWIEAARWLAPLATASGVIFAIQYFRSKTKDLFAYCTGRSVAVFGPEEECAELMGELGISGIRIKEHFVKAHSYILLGSEKENLDFYHTNSSKLKNRNVYLRCQNLPVHSETDPKLHLFCPEETAARIFWKQYSPYPLSRQSDHHFSIVVIGFGKLGKELLLSGLQYNIFSRDQEIQYHIIGEEAGFRNIYYQLSEISDTVDFHTGNWHEHSALIRNADMVIIAQQHEQLSLLGEMTLAFPGKPLHVLAARQQDVVLVKRVGSAICVFDWLSHSRKKDAIVSSKMHDLAMRINLRYAYLYNHIPETEDNKQTQWAQLNSFTRYSNIRPADYHDIRKQMVIANGWTAPLTPAQKEELAELEHIRWCRYHFLNNWKQGIPENGAAKDPIVRIHKSLVPYQNLSEEEKDKDRQVIDILFSLSPLESTDCYSTAK